MIERMSYCKKITGEHDAGDAQLNTITEAQEEGAGGGATSEDDEAVDSASATAIIDEDNQAAPEEVRNGRVTMLQNTPSQDSQEDNFW